LAAGREADFSRSGAGYLRISAKALAYEEALKSAGHSLPSNH
jgi:hypothetical protein